VVAAISRPTISDASERGVAPAVSTGRDGLPVAEHGDTVGDRLHLVQLVRDEDDRATLVGHHAQRLEQGRGLLRRQHRRRLVENQHPCVAIERLQDLDALLLAERQLPDMSTRIDSDPVAVAKLGDVALDAPRMDDELPSFAPMIAEDHVLGDGERRHEPKVLMHHPHARVEGVARRRERDRLPVQLDLALVRPVQAGQDVRERRLAGAVLTEEGMDLALGRLELDPVVGDDARKPLGDAPERDGCRHRKTGRARPRPRPPCRS